MHRKRRPIWERFDALYDRDSEHECWFWRSATVNGYGVFTVEKGFSVKAHRLAYERAYGPIPPGKMVLHSNECLLRTCVNPRHLRVGTHADNMKDLEQSGRARVLSRDEAKELLRLRDLGCTWLELSAQFRASPPVLARVVRRARAGDFGGDQPSKSPRKYVRTTPDMRTQMKALVDGGTSISEIARMFNVAGKTVRTYCGCSRVRSGRPLTPH